MVPTIAIIYCVLTIGPALTAQSCPVVAQAQHCSEHFTYVLSFKPHNDPNDTINIILISQMRKLYQRRKMISPQPHSIKWCSGCYWIPITTCFNGDLTHRGEVLIGGFQASLGLVGKSSVPLQV